LPHQEQEDHHPLLVPSIADDHMHDTDAKSLLPQSFEHKQEAPYVTDNHRPYRQAHDQHAKNKNRKDNDSSNVWLLAQWQANTQITDYFWWFAYRKRRL